MLKPRSTDAVHITDYHGRTREHTAPVMVSVKEPSSEILSPEECQ